MLDPNKSLVYIIQIAIFVIFMGSILAINMHQDKWFWNNEGIQKTNRKNVVTSIFVFIGILEITMLYINTNIIYFASVQADFLTPTRF